MILSFFLSIFPQSGVIVNFGDVSILSWNRGIFGWKFSPRKWVHHVGAENPVHNVIMWDSECSSLGFTSCVEFKISEKCVHFV